MSVMYTAHDRARKGREAELCSECCANSLHRPQHTYIKHHDLPDWTKLLALLTDILSDLLQSGWRVLSTRDRQQAYLVGGVCV